MLDDYCPGQCIRHDCSLLNWSYGPVVTNFMPTMIKKGLVKNQFQEWMFLWMKSPGNESFGEWKVPGTKVPRKVLGTKVPKNVNVKSWELMLGTNVPHRDYSFLGTKGLGYKKSVILWTTSGCGLMMHQPIGLSAITLIDRWRQSMFWSYCVWFVESRQL